MLLMHDMTEAMDVLLATRDGCGVLSSNVVFFALPGLASLLQFYPVLRWVAASAQLKSYYGFQTALGYPSWRATRGPTLWSMHG